MLHRFSSRKSQQEVRPARHDISLPPVADRRKQLRDTTKQSVWITLSDDTHRTLEGHIVDVSSNGMKLSLQDSLPLVTAISVECEECIVPATVAYCLRDPGSAGCGEWQIGIQILHRSWELVAPLVSSDEKKRIRERIAEHAAKTTDRTESPGGRISGNSARILR